VTRAVLSARLVMMAFSMRLVEAVRVGAGRCSNKRRRYPLITR
jgi:hypothetical protein